MTKTECIKLLEHKAASLEAHLAAMSERVNAIEARPIYPQWTYTTPEPKGYIGGPWDEYSTHTAILGVNDGYV